MRESHTSHFGVMESDHPMMTHLMMNKRNVVNEERKVKQTKLDDREYELESVFKQLKETSEVLRGTHDCSKDS